MFASYRSGEKRKFSVSISRSVHCSPICLSDVAIAFEIFSQCMFKKFVLFRIVEQQRGGALFWYVVIANSALGGGWKLNTGCLIKIARGGLINQNTVVHMLLKTSDKNSSPARRRERERERTLARYTRSLLAVTWPILAKLFAERFLGIAMKFGRRAYPVSPDDRVLYLENTYSSLIIVRNS